MKVISESVIAEPVIRSRVLRILRTEWADNGLSFDVYDDATNLCLTPTAFDEWPDVDELEDMADQLIDDLDTDTLDPYYLHPEDRAMLADVLTGMRGPCWSCPGCGWSYAETDADMITEHVDSCDGAGAPLT